MTIYDYGRSPEHWLTAMDIASANLQFLSPTDLAVDAKCWMLANDYDVAFLEGKPRRIVIREQLIACEASQQVAEFAEKLPADRCHSCHLTLEQTLSTMQKQEWFVLLNDDQIVGVITEEDLEKPAMSAYVLWHFITLERGLRRLIGTYTSNPLPDEPVDKSLVPEEELPDTVLTLTDAMKAARSIHELLSALGVSRNKFSNLSSWR